LCAEEQDEDFAAEKADIVREIKNLVASEPQNEALTGDLSNAGSAEGSRRATAELLPTMSFSTMHVRDEGCDTEELARATMR
jgi:folylpolyglutamate synthase/dihydropteroate synthase